MTHQILAAENFAALAKNEYPGRMIVMGMDNNGNMVQIYGIMGRSQNSRNRVLCSDVGGRLFTKAADPEQMKDPKLVIYNAMREDQNKLGRSFVVSNGDQTDTVATGHEDTLAQALVGRIYEPDAPNFTPRITGLFVLAGANSRMELSVLKKSLWTDDCDRFNYTYDYVEPGYGFGVTTYMGDGNPLPAWVGEPILLPIDGENITDIAQKYWAILNPANRVAMAVKLIPGTGGSTIHIVNQYQEVPIQLPASPAP